VLSLPTSNIFVINNENTTHEVQMTCLFKSPKKLRLFNALGSLYDVSRSIQLKVTQQLPI
jgi:hypothetical protein